MITIPARYRINGAASSGGMSHAYVCRDSHLDRDVLIKELQGGIDQRRIFDEVAALTAIRSKHVVQIYDVVRDNRGQIVGIVEEYISGNDLEDVIPVANLDELLRILYAISCGISDIHAAGRVHRDIKPNNIKFDVEGCLKIFDFGLAKDGRTIAATQGAVGTRGYMAPELCVDDDEVAEFDYAVDVYAFGSTALKIATGAIPRELRQIPPSLPCPQADFSSLSTSLPSDVAEVLNSCLLVSPDDRPAMARVRDIIGAQILRDKHRATLVVQGAVHVLEASRRAVVITVPGGVAEIRYNGLSFGIIPKSGDVYVNNIKIDRPQNMPKSCVVTFGAPSLGMSRIHVPVDVSHPEVWL